MKDLKVTLIEKGFTGYGHNNITVTVTKITSYAIRNHYFQSIKNYISLHRRLVM